MGNCMSACCGRHRRDSFRLSSFDIDAISLQALYPQHPNQRAGSPNNASHDDDDDDDDVYPYPSIPVTTSDFRLAPTVPYHGMNTSAVNNHTSSSRGDDSTAIRHDKPSTPDNAPTLEDGAVSLSNRNIGSDNDNDSLDNVSFGNAQIQTIQAKPVVHKGKGHLVEVKSTGNLRALGLASGLPSGASTGSFSMPRGHPLGIPKSASMMDINKPLPKHPNDDPVAAYIERNKIILKSASQIFEVRSESLKGYFRQKEAEEKAARAAEAAGGSKRGSEDNRKNDLKEEVAQAKAQIMEMAKETNWMPCQMYMVPFPDDNGPAPKNNPDAGPSGDGETGGDAAFPKVHSPSKRYADQIRTMTQKAPRPSCIGSSLPIDAIWPVFSPDTPSSPITSLSPASDGSPAYFISSADRVGASGQGRSIRAPVNGAIPSGPFSPCRPRLQFGTRSDERLSVVAESDMSRMGVVCDSTSPPQTRAIRKQDAEYPNWEKVILEYNQKLKEAEPVIFLKVIGFATNTQEAIAITRNILRMGDSVIQTCLDNEDNEHFIQQKVEEIRTNLKGPEIGNLGQLLEEDILYQPQAEASIENWGTEQDAKIKGEGKANREVAVYRGKFREGE